MALVTTVHENDFLLQFIQERNGLSREDALVQYLLNGRESADKLSRIVRDLRGPQPFSLLDFASGYGMVARHYAEAMPQAQVTTCDIHPQANAFNREKFGFDTLQSQSVPEDFAVDRQFDVVFTLSFFSHISDAYFVRWLMRLYQLVKPGGYLIFTTHGRVTSNYVLGKNQIVFYPDSEQKDLEGQYYGTAYTHPSYVFDKVSDLHAHAPVRFELFKEGFWWGHQDLYVLHRMA